MRKFLAFILAAVLALSVCACGSKKNNDQPTGEDTSSESADQDTSEQENEEPAEEDDLEKDMEELSAFGEVEVVNGILTVSITVPSILAGEITQEQLDEDAGVKYLSATLNEDGSVTYKMTKEQYAEMLASISESIDESLQEMVDDDENYTMTAITHNENYTVFDVTLEGDELGLGDIFSVYTFYMCGGLYGVFSGNSAEHAIVNFYDPDGNLIDSLDSANLMGVGNN